MEIRRRYKALFEQRLFGVFVHDFEGRIIDMNDAALGFLGYSHRDLNGLTLAALLEDHQLPNAMEAIAEIAHAGSPEKIYRFVVRKKTGELLWVQTQGFLLRHRGKPWAILCMGHDVTERQLAEEAPATKKERVTVTVRSKRSARLLLMDDELMVRTVAGKMLGHLGHEVTFAKNGEETIEQYRLAQQAGRPFAAVIMDLTVPGGMGGKEALKYLREIDPKIKAIVSSGYSTDPVMALHAKYGFSDVITKPYTIQELDDVLSRVLTAPPAPQPPPAGSSRLGKPLITRKPSD